MHVSQEHAIKLPDAILEKNGQYSDDTQLTRETLLAVMQSGLNQDVFATRLAMQFQPGAPLIVGYGSTTLRSALRIRNGASREESGVRDTIGNGSAMRSAVLGLLCKEQDDIVRVASEWSRVSHASPSTMAGASIMALAARFVAGTGSSPFDVRSFFAYLVAATDFVPFRDLLGVVYEHVYEKSDTDVVVERLKRFAEMHGESYRADRMAAQVLQTVAYALYCFAACPDDYMECIRLCLHPGGDVDTIAAMAGALCGTRVGVNGIPLAIRNAINDRGSFGCTQLASIAKQAFHRR